MRTETKIRTVSVHSLKIVYKKIFIIATISKEKFIKKENLFTILIYILNKIKSLLSTPVKYYYVHIKTMFRIIDK